MRCVCRLSLNWYLSKVSRAQAGAVGFKGKATVGEDRARHFPWRVRAASISSHCDASLRVLTVLLRNGRGGPPGDSLAPPLRHCSLTSLLLPGMARKWLGTCPGPCGKKDQPVYPELPHSRDPGLASSLGLCPGSPLCYGPLFDARAPGLTGRRSL